MTVSLNLLAKKERMLLMRIKRFNQLGQFPQKLISFLNIAFKSTGQSHPSLEIRSEIDRVTKIINDHPFPDQPLDSILIQHVPKHLLSSTFVENVLGRLFAAHSNGLKAFEFFKFSLKNSELCPSADAFEKTLHILTRMHYIDKAWELMEEIQQKYPFLLTLKSMSIMLSRIAKFRSYESTLEAFERMEKNIFIGREFGADEFNVLLRAFCTQRQMKEARSVFHKMHARFSPDTRTMNILLLGFKESGDVTAVELFYYEMILRGFKPNSVTYNIRIDAYCKKGAFGDGLRLLEEMEKANCPPTLETITTLIHGAGVARNISRARELFNELSTRNLQPDTGVYNALMSSLIRCREVQSALVLMDEMEEKGIGHDSMTYHTMFIGLMKSNGIEGVSELYHKMIRKNFVPQARTVVMLMKWFCQNQQLDTSLGLWAYLMDRGYCPHSHVLDLLVTGLCSHGRVKEAVECAKQMLGRGRPMSEGVFRMLERHLVEAGESEILWKLDKMIKKLQTVLPPSRGHATGLADSNLVT